MAQGIIDAGLGVSTHSRLKAAGHCLHSTVHADSVSTHSRLKAAGATPSNTFGGTKSFNTQPPEGGWEAVLDRLTAAYPFQHTAA